MFRMLLGQSLQLHCYKSIRPLSAPGLTDIAACIEGNLAGISLPGFGFLT